MTLFKTVTVLTALTLSHYANAETTLKVQSAVQQTPLVELYTSQGCYSCPPAEKWLNKLVNAPGLWQDFVPLALHVGYWDYLGWKDPYGDQRNVKRQYKYRSQELIPGVYTPQVIVDGRDTKRWRTMTDLQFKKGIDAGVLSVEAAQQNLAVSFKPVIKRDDALRVHVAVLGFGIATKVVSGENKGKQLAQEFIVLEQNSAISTVDNGSHSWQVAMPETDYDGRLALVAWVDSPSNNTPLQSVGTWLGAQ